MNKKLVKLITLCLMAFFMVCCSESNVDVSITDNTDEQATDSTEDQTIDGTDSDSTTEITDEQVEVMTEVVFNIEDKSAELYSQSLTTEEFKDSLVEFILEQNGVEDVTYDEDNYTLEIAYDSGLYSYVTLDYAEYFTEDDESYTEVVSNVTSSINTVGYNTRSADSSLSSGENIIENNKVLIWSTCENDYYDITEDGYKIYYIKDYITTLKNLFATSNYQLVVTHENTNCDIASLKNLNDYGTVILFTHGSIDSGGLKLMTNESVTLTIDELTYNGKYDEEMRKGYIAYCTNAIYRLKEEPIVTKFAIRPSFIEKCINGDFPNSIIYCGVCFSAAEKSTLWNAFKQRGAKAFIGYNNEIMQKKALGNSIDFFDVLLGHSASRSDTVTASSLKTTNDANNTLDSIFTFNTYIYDENGNKKTDWWGNYELRSVTVETIYEYDSHMKYGPIGQLSVSDTQSTYAYLGLTTYPDYFLFLYYPLFPDPNKINIKYRKKDSSDICEKSISYYDSILVLDGLTPNTEYEIIDAQIVVGNAYYLNSIYYGDNGIVSEQNPILVTTKESDSNLSLPELGEVEL